MKMLLFFCILSSAFCTPYVDLGKAGNLYGISKYQSYLKKSNHCFSRETNNPRVIISGFSNWKKAKVNVSSSVLEELAGEVISLEESSYFGEVLNKTMSIEGKDIDICFLKLAVTWDISSAILIHEAQIFKPDLVVMMGDGLKGKLMIETRAKNSSILLSGINHRGDELGKLNTPKWFGSLTGKFRAPKYVDMNWDSKTMESEFLKIGENYGEKFKIQLNSNHLKSNIYICNALSYTFMQAAQNRSIYLFKKKLKLFPKFDKTFKVGFLHLPALEKDETETPHTFELVEMLEKTLIINLNL